MLPPHNFNLFELDFSVKFPSLRLLQFLIDLKGLCLIRVMSIVVAYIWTIAGSLSGGFRWISLVIPGYLMVILSGRVCRRFLQLTGKLIGEN